MSKLVEIYGSPLFHINGRCKIINLRNISIAANGIIINNFKNRQIVIKDEESKLKFVNMIMNDISDEELKSDNNSIMTACVNLGDFVNRNMDIFEDFAINYLIYKNQTEFNLKRAARIFDGEHETSEFYKLNKTYLNFNISMINKMDFITLEYQEPKYVKDAKFNKLLLQWFNSCGVSEKDIFDLNNSHIISIETLLEILDLSLTIYRKFRDLINNNHFDAQDINVKYHIEYSDNNGTFKIERYTDDLLSYVMLLFTSYYKGDFKNIRCCEYCNSYFFGRKDKKCCSSRCKDLKNNKYEKRKERQKRSDTKCIKK